MRYVLKAIDSQKLRTKRLRVLQVPTRKRDPDRAPRLNEAFPEGPRGNERPA